MLHADTPRADDVLVGVDGGATRTRVLVGTRRGDRLASLEGPGSLVRPSAPEAGMGALAQQVLDAVEHAGRAPAHALCCALAGAGRPEEQRRIETALQARTHVARVRVIPDIEAGMWDAFHGGDGILLLAGTGSIARADHAGRSARAGGWGATFGDEGSAFVIGRAALAAVARAHDGRGPATDLTHAILRHTGCTTPEALIAWADRAPKADIAALAICVLDVAADTAAGAILDAAAADLAAHVRALYTRLGPWHEPPPLAFAGGNLHPSSILRARVVARLEAANVPVAPLPQAVDAARGALALATGL